jgi:hypothetical protein
MIRRLLLHSPLATSRLENFALTDLWVAFLRSTTSKIEGWERYRDLQWTLMMTKHVLSLRPDPRSSQAGRRELEFSKEAILNNCCSELLRSKLWIALAAKDRKRLPANQAIDIRTKISGPVCPNVALGNTINQYLCLL